MNPLIWVICCALCITCVLCFSVEKQPNLKFEQYIGKVNKEICNGRDN